MIIYLSIKAAGSVIFALCSPDIQDILGLSFYLSRQLAVLYLLYVLLISRAENFRMVDIRINA